MSLDHSLIGKGTEPQVFEVTEEAVRRFMEATEDPALRDGTPIEFAPLTFPTTFRTRVPGLQLDNSKVQVIHGEQQYHYTRRLKVGEKVTCVARITDMREREGKSGPMTFLTTETYGTDGEGRPVFTALSLGIVRVRGEGGGS